MPLSIHINGFNYWGIELLLVMSPVFKCVKTKTNFRWLLYIKKNENNNFTHLLHTTKMQFSDVSVKPNTAEVLALWRQCVFCKWWFDLLPSRRAHHSNYTLGCWLCVKPPSEHFHFPDQIRNLFNHPAQTLTIVRPGSHLLHCVHVVDHDAFRNVWPACGFTVHYDDILQPRHVTQNGLWHRDRCRWEGGGKRH